MRALIAGALCICLTVGVFAGDATGFKLKYNGGSLGDLKTGAALKLHLEQNQIRITGSALILCGWGMLRFRLSPS
jgi:hypothetical protein